MNISTVKISLRDENSFDFSYSIITKGEKSIVIILKDADCGIFDYEAMKNDDFVYSYLLLKHYTTTSVAYKDFLKLNGKMCAKKENSKYFGSHKDEDNRMICDIGGSRMICNDEISAYRERYENFKNSILEYKNKI